MRIYRVDVNRPRVENRDFWETCRTAMVCADSLDKAAQTVVAYYNDVEDVTDYFVTDIGIAASTESGEGDILIMCDERYAER